MSKPLTVFDFDVWDNLIAAAINPKASVAQINRRARRAGAKARIPGGYDHTKSCFVLLVRVGRDLKAGDAISRQLIVDHAHECQKVLNVLRRPVALPTRKDIDD